MLHKKSFRLLFILISTLSLSFSIVPTKKNITFGLAGDVMLGRLVNKMMLKKDILYPWGTMLPLLKKNNFNMVNLETTLTTNKKKVPKAFNFKSKPEHALALKEANIQIVNNANNHILDFGIKGMEETLIALNKTNIYHVGAGMNLQQAQRPVFFTKNGIRFAVLGFTDNEALWAATDKKPGINYITIHQKTADSLKDLIKNTKKNSDVLIVSLHWGPNWEEKPNKDFRDFAHTLIDAGVDIIHGHSPHIFQGIELYKNKLIFYSCGDFLDDYAIDKVLRNDETFLFVVTVDTQGIQKLQLIPAIISNMQVNKAEGKDALRLIQKMQKLSQELGTMKIDDQGLWQR